MWISIIVSKLTKEELESDTAVFEGKARIIEDIINRQLALQKFKVQGVRKITLTLTLEKNVDVIMPPLKGVSPVVNISRTFDINAFNQSAEAAQNEIILSLVKDELDEAALKFGWDNRSFDNAINKVRELDFKQHYQEWKPKTAPDKRHKAAVEIEMNAKASIISIVFYSHDGSVIKSIKVMEVRPNRLFITPLMGKCQWNNNSEFELIDKRNEIHFRASLMSDSADTYFTPIDRNLDQIIDDVLILSASTSTEQAQSLLRVKLRNTKPKW